MKPSTLLLAAATTLLVGSTAVAQTSLRSGQYSPREYPSQARPAVEYRILDSLGNAFSFYSSSAEPVKYDPLLNILGVIKRGNPGQSGNRVFIYSSPDLGVTWSAPLGPLHNFEAAGSGPARYPSIVVNPTHSTNPAEFFYYYTTPILLNGAFGGLATGLVDQAGNDIVPAQYSGGIDDALYGSDARSIETADGQVVVSIHISGGEAIAVRRLDLSAGTLTESVPPQFAADKFSVDPAGPTTTTGGIGRDANGAIYAMIWARTPQTDAFSAVDTMVMPLISKSMDNGVTWSEMMPLDRQVLVDYANSVGMSAFSTRYGPTGFAVTGPDRYSMAFMLTETDTNSTVPSQIIEVRYNAGNWGVFKIADVNGWYTLDNGGGSFTDSQMENEIQLVATADGSKLVAKWTDAVSYLITEDINGDGEGDDTLGTSDVFVSSRATSQGTWSTPKNVTETPVLDRNTWIPVNLLPNDLTNVPMISVQTIPSDADVTIEDAFFHSQRVLADRPQYVVVTNIDASGAPSSAPVAGEATSSRIASVAPNPTSGAATVSINVARRGTGSVELWNALGERVSVLADGTLEAGTKTFTLDGSSLPVGAYYVAMKIDGQTLTQPFSVVR